MREGGGYNAKPVSKAKLPLGVSESCRTCEGGGGIAGQRGAPRPKRKPLVPRGWSNAGKPAKFSSGGIRHRGVACRNCGSAAAAGARPCGAAGCRRIQNRAGKCGNGRVCQRCSFDPLSPALGPPPWRRIRRPDGDGGAAGQERLQGVEHKPGSANRPVINRSPIDLPENFLGHRNRDPVGFRFVGHCGRLLSPARPCRADCATARPGR